MNEIYATSQTFYDDVVNITGVTRLTLIQISLHATWLYLSNSTVRYMISVLACGLINISSGTKSIALNFPKIVLPVIALNKSFILPRDFVTFKAA